MWGVRMGVKEQPTKVKMAIGIDNFREMREKQNYYVDKTRLIAEYLTAGLQGEVVCIGLGHRGKEAEIEWLIR